MKKTNLIIPLLALALTASALASGSAPTRPPRPPQGFEPATTQTDEAKYALGKSVFTGKAQHVANPSATKKQRARLTELAAKSGKAGASLPSLAGKLSNEQMDALDYYVNKRFGAH
jgi:hypothetical protein